MKVIGGIRKGKRGRGVGGKVYMAIIPSVHDETLIPIIEKRAQPDSIIYNDHIQGL